MRRKKAVIQLASIVVVAILALAWTFQSGNKPLLGLDLQGGTSVVLGVKAGQSATSGQLDQAISIIRRRVDGLGVAEPEITRQGKFIVVSLPGVKDSQRAIELVGRTAKLQFRPGKPVKTPARPSRSLDSLRELTPARVGLGRSGASMPSSNTRSRTAAAMSGLLPSRPTSV